jgi:cell division protein FtsA
VKDEIERTGEADRLSSGVVLTGGGSLLAGIVDLAQVVLAMPVRQGLPHGVQGLTQELTHPVYATAVGLAKLGGQSGLDRMKRSTRSGSRPWLMHRFLSWVGN